MTVFNIKFKNILRCERCGLEIIDEEFHIHKCTKIIDYKIKDNVLWAFDGNIWIPRKLSPPKNKHPFSTPDGETEPKN